MQRLKPFVIAVVMAVSALAISPWTGATVVQAQTPPQTEQQKTFQSIDDLPPQEQLPAARLVIAAYVFVMVVFFVYLLSVARRLGVVSRELDRLESETKRGHRT